MQKACAGSYVLLDPRLHLAATLGLYAFLLLGWAAVRLARLQPVRPKSYFHWVIAALTPVAAVLFFVILHAKDLRVESCSYTSASHVAVLVVDFFFFFRLLVEVLEGHVPELIPTLTDGWLLVNTVWKMVHRVVISEYHFLVLMRFSYRQTLDLYSRLFTRLFGVSVKQGIFQLLVVIVGVFVLAGAIQTAEEWSQLLGIHPDDEGQVTAWHSFWDYMYMGYITVSTVGYGDMTPSTLTGQAIVVAAIVGFVAWYTNNSQELYDALKGIIFNVMGHVPPLPSTRRLVVVGCLEANKTQQLVSHLVAREETQIIIGVDRDESLSVHQVPGVFVITTELNRRFFKRCFPQHTDTVGWRPSYSLMILNQQGDGDEVGALDSDLRVLSLIQLVKAEVPDVAVVAQVWRSESREAVLNIEGWGRAHDQVVCHEELMAGLITKAVAAEGAASILASLITFPPCTVLPAQIHTCTEKITCAYLLGQSLVLALSDSEGTESESFEQAALHLYKHKRTLLLGYVQHVNEGSWKNRCSILPTFLPPDARRIVITPSDLVTVKGSANIPTTHDSVKINYSPSDQRPPDISLKLKTVRVLRDGPAGRLTRGLSQPYLRMLTDKEEDTHLDVAAVLEPHSESGRALYDNYCVKADLAESSPWARLVTNVEHGMKPGTWRVSGGSPHASTSYVNPCVVTSAVCSAHHSEFFFSLWRFLVQECRLVELEVTEYCSYGRVFQYLLTHYHMLALGATVQLSSHSRPACCKVLHLDPDNTGSLAVTNPDFDFSLHPGDKVVAFPYVE